MTKFMMLFIIKPIVNNTHNNIHDTDYTDTDLVQFERTLPRISKEEF